MSVPSKVVLLTGASRGIGLCVAEELLSQPSRHRLVVSARSESPLRQLSDRYPSRVAVCTGNLADPALGCKCVALGLSKFGRIDSVIVNHATLEPVKRFADTCLGEWESAYNVNFFSAVSIMQACMQPLRESRGTVVVVTSSTSVTPFGSLGAYGSTKAALNHLVSVLHEEEECITAVAIRPGEVDTDLQRSIREKYAPAGLMPRGDAERLIRLQRTGGLLPPAVPARVIAELALNADRGLGGKLFKWDDDALKPHRA